MAKTKYPDAHEAPPGMVGLWIDPQGHVIANASDFHRDRPGGFRLYDAQEHRARKSLYRAMVYQYCSSILADCLSEYEIDCIARRMIEKGHTTSFVTIGEDTDR